MKKLVDLSYHGSHYNLTAEEYLIKSKSNIGYAKFLKSKYSISFIFHTAFNRRFVRDGFEFLFRRKKINSKFLLPFKLSLDLKNLRPSVILVHSIIYIHFAALLRLLIGNEIIIIIQNHGESPPTALFKKRLIRYCDQYIDGYLFTSKQMESPWLSDGLIASPKKVFEVMEGSSDFLPNDKLGSKRNLGISPSKPVFLWVGRLDHNKDPMCVLEAMKRFRDSGSEFEFFMFYHETDLLDKIQNFISTNKLDNCIFLKGKVSHEQLEQWYNAADYYVSASHKEGSGYALCEAMACECIPIVSNIPSFEYMTQNGYAGLIFHKGNAESLLESLIKANKIDIEEYKRNVRKVFKERLSFEAIARGIEATIEEISIQKNKS